MRPRWQVALFLLTCPIWLLPVLIYVGWKEAGRDFIKDLPKGARYAFLGEPFR